MDSKKYGMEFPACSLNPKKTICLHMATILDLGLVRSFDVIYAWIFVFAIAFAILVKTELIGKDNKAINAILAFALATIMLLSRVAIDVINAMIPWFVVAIIFLLFVILIFKLFGTEESKIKEAVAKDPAIYWTLIGIAIIIMVAAFGQVLGQSLTEQAFQQGTTNATISTGTGAGANFQQNIYATLFHPKVLGLIVIFLIAVFAVALLSSG